MTELLFLTDAYVKAFEAVVTTQVDGGVVLDRTAFYPGGGGQPCDFGVLQAEDQTWDVKKVKKVAGQVVHFIDGDLPALETAVTGKLITFCPGLTMRFDYVFGHRHSRAKRQGLQKVAGGLFQINPQRIYISCADPHLLGIPVAACLLWCGSTNIIKNRG